MGVKQVCFVDMPFGKKPDLASGVEIDFDVIYSKAIEPAIKDAGLEPIRGDRERTGGIIHTAMFGRLLLSDYLVADLTLANPNVYYELGIRHTALPYTTVPIFASVHPLPFDVSMVRAIPYTLENGILTDAAADKLRSDILARLQQAIQGAASNDSPLFQLISGFPRIDLPHQVTEIFQDQVRHAEEFRRQLSEARAKASDSKRLEALKEIQQGLGDLKVAQKEVLVDLMLSYRDVSAWDQMVKLSDAFPDFLKNNVIVRQQRALALNRRNQGNDREQATRILNDLLKERGPDPETLGILGRVYKDSYKELKAKDSIMASAALDDAIEAYTKGFESDPRDYYPGVNAVTLLVEKGDPESLAKADKLVPLVSFAVARRGGASSSDYWDLATVLELSAIGNDWSQVNRVLPRVLNTAKKAWNVRTTCDNLLLLKAARERSGQKLPELETVIRHLEERFTQLREGEKKEAETKSVRS